MIDKDTQLAASDFNLEKINTVEYEEILKAAIETESNVVVISQRGSGKTSIAKQAIIDFKSENIPKVKEAYMNLSVVERTDMGGYPDMFGIIKKDATAAEKRQRFVDVILPRWLEPLIEGDVPVVALLDEVDKVDPSVYGPLLELVQFKSINGTLLKNLRACVMIGNLISEGGSRPSLPLMDRAEKYLLEADANLWLSWAGRTGKIHPTVTSFIYDKNSELHSSADSGENYGGASPRTWDLASQAIKNGEKLGWSKELILKKVSGFVGKTAGTSYKIYFEHYQVLLPLIKRLFEGYDISKEYLDLDPSHQSLACMVICSRLVGDVERSKKLNGELPDSVYHIGKFMNKTAGQENVLISVRTQITSKRVVEWGLDSDHYPDWKSVLYDICNNIEYS